MVYSDFVKQKILFFHHLGKSYAIVCSLTEGNATTKAGVYKFIQCYEETGMIACTPGSSQTLKNTTEAENRRRANGKG